MQSLFASSEACHQESYEENGPGKQFTNRAKAGPPEADPPASEIGDFDANESFPYCALPGGTLHQGRVEQAGHNPYDDGPCGIGQLLNSVESSQQPSQDQRERDRNYPAINPPSKEPPPEVRGHENACWLRQSTRYCQRPRRDGDTESKATLRTERSPGCSQLAAVFTISSRIVHGNPSLPFKRKDIYVKTVYLQSVDLARMLPGNSGACKMNES
jgi:hypothetical protein